MLTNHVFLFNILTCVFLINQKKGKLISSQEVLCMDIDRAPAGTSNREKNVMWYNFDQVRNFLWLKFLCFTLQYLSGISG